MKLENVDRVRDLIKELDKFEDFQKEMYEPASTECLRIMVSYPTRNNPTNQEARLECDTKREEKFIREVLGMVRNATQNQIDVIRGEIATL